jgi:hypothetical protein
MTVLPQLKIQIPGAYGFSLILPDLGQILPSGFSHNPILDRFHPPIDSPRTKPPSRTNFAVGQCSRHQTNRALCRRHLRTEIRKSAQTQVPRSGPPEPQKNQFVSQAGGSTEVGEVPNKSSTRNSFNGQVSPSPSRRVRALLCSRWNILMPGNCR